MHYTHLASQLNITVVINLLQVVENPDVTGDKADLLEEPMLCVL
uniref:Uncharacterized protein n=1 Tax=Anguilla anguilla TaxID=7936 RepID=A0A0E9QVJ2_ANGAN